MNENRITYSILNQAKRRVMFLVNRLIIRENHWKIQVWRQVRVEMNNRFDSKILTSFKDIK
jgi:hypothetical protein